MGWTLAPIGFYTNPNYTSSNRFSVPFRPPWAPAHKHTTYMHINKYIHTHNYSHLPALTFLYTEALNLHKIKDLHSYR